MTRAALADSGRRKPGARTDVPRDSARSGNLVSAMGEPQTRDAAAQHQALVDWVATLRDAGRYAEALPFARTAAHLARRLYGKQHPFYSAALNNLGMLYQHVLHYRRAERVLLLALATDRQAGRQNHPDYTASLLNLARLYQEIGDYRRAEPLYCQALRVWRGQPAQDPRQYLRCLSDLAGLHHQMGDYARAEPLYRRVLGALEQAGAKERPEYAASLSNLALLYQERGDFARAEAFYSQVLEMWERAAGVEDLDYATILNNLALLYRDTGHYAAAKQRLLQARTIIERSRGMEHRDYARSLTSLAMLSKDAGDFSDAKEHFAQALEINKRTIGESHPHYASAVHNLALIHALVGDHSLAEDLYRQALALCKRALGTRHPDYAACLHDLAELYYQQGAGHHAERLLRQALAIRRRVLMQQHPDCARTLEALAELYARSEKTRRSLTLMRRVGRIDDSMIAQVFSFGSEIHRTAFLRKTERNLDAFLSLIWRHLRNDSHAVAYALDLVVRRKAVALEALAAQRDAVLIGEHPDLAEQLETLNRLRMQVAQVVLRGPRDGGDDLYRHRLARWQNERDRLEARLARQIPEMNLERRLRRADRGAVVAALPTRSVLIEFVRFNVLDFKSIGDQPRWQGARYVAFVLPAGKPTAINKMIDLGDAQVIDAEIAAFRDEMRYDCASSGAFLRHGNRLRELIFDPLALPPGTRIFVSPEGDLNLLPLEALPTGEDRFLIEDWHFSYVCASRDVLRFNQPTGTASGPLIIADPDVNLTAPKADPSAAQAGLAQVLPGRRSQHLAQIVQFERLPGAREEGDQIADLLEEAMATKPLVWTDGEVLDSRLKTARSPILLHVAAEGFFLQDQDWDATIEEPALPGPGDEMYRGALENPLVRSGLALAGANSALRGKSLPPEAEDGLLTAEDVSGMSLLGTELVVLSACDTGIGEVKRGEGVFGLRRAFVHAGARTLVMSLWKVPDGETRALMEELYTRLLTGEGRAEALRNAQLALLSSLRLQGLSAHPFYWGAFICQGDPGPLRLALYADSSVGKTCQAPQLRCKI